MTLLLPLLWSDGLFFSRIVKVFQHSNSFAVAIQLIFVLRSKHERLVDRNNPRTSLGWCCVLAIPQHLLRLLQQFRELLNLLLDCFFIVHDVNPSS